MKSKRALVAVLILSTILALPVGGFAQSASGGGGTNWGNVGYDAGSVVCSLIYFPFKAAYAILGGVIGGGAYLATAGNSQVANQIWRPSIGGDYLVTPGMLRGTQPLHFSGPQ
ncbi:MAG TPA: hypothetical protein VKV28_11190 [Candidatus Binataceae bacterium]|nr:hypothetical protein [Candidatus Binataceae bacterium]